MMYSDCFVIRNAGGRAERALPDLIALDQLAELKIVLVIHHTGKLAIRNFIMDVETSGQIAG